MLFHVGRKKMEWAISMGVELMFSVLGLFVPFYRLLWYHWCFRSLCREVRFAGLIGAVHAGEPVLQDLWLGLNGEEFIREMRIWIPAGCHGERSFNGHQITPHQPLFRGSDTENVGDIVSATWFLTGILLLQAERYKIKSFTFQNWHSSEMQLPEPIILATFSTSPTNIHVYGAPFAPPEATYIKLKRIIRRPLFPVLLRFPRIPRITSATQDIPGLAPNNPRTSPRIKIETSPITYPSKSGLPKTPSNSKIPTSKRDLLHLLLPASPIQR